MKPEYRLKKNYQYNYVFKHSESVADKFFVVLYCASKYKQTKVGFSISKKYGNAVKRNRLRRQMKAAVQNIIPHLNEGFNVVVIPRKQTEYAFDCISQSLQNLFSKAGLTC